MHMGTHVPVESRKGYGSPGAGVKADCDLPSVGIENSSQSSLRVVCPFNHGIISPAPTIHNLWVSYNYNGKAQEVLSNGAEMGQAQPQWI